MVSRSIGTETSVAKHRLYRSRRVLTVSQSEDRARATSHGARPQGRERPDASHSRRAPQPLSDEPIELIAARLRVIAEPNRIRIIGLLNEGEATVQELTDRLITTHQNVSTHLGVLYQAGMVSRP